MMTWPDNLVDAIARRKCVLFLGSGISANSCNEEGKHPATWEDFLRGILTKRPDKLNEHKTVIERLLSESDKVITARDIIEMKKREIIQKSEFFYLHQISFML